MNERLAAGAAAIQGGLATIALVSRCWPARFRPWPRARYAAAEFASLDELMGVRWLPCHNLACAHLTTRHLLQPDGTHACGDCGTTATEGD